MQESFSKKQLEFILKGTKKWNLAHGAVRCGKTVCTVYAFMHAITQSKGSKFYIIGHTFETAYRNIVRMIMETDEFSLFSKQCAWSGKRLHFQDKTIVILGAKDEGAIGQFQGDTWDLCYCDEMTLYPESIIDMIDTRLSPSESKGYAAMNPSHPGHKLKQWIDLAEKGDPNYYALHFTLEDTPYVDESYKMRLRNSLSGLFYKRNYLGLWVLADGAIFDFFDRKTHLISRPPAAEYYIAGIDYGLNNPFACLLIGVSTGKYTQTGKCLWVEKEYYWDPKNKETYRQKTVSELAKDIAEFIEPYNVRHVYIDPSALAMKIDLRRLNIPTIDANNEVLDGIGIMTSEMAKGNLFVMPNCKNLIREIESYVWDSRAAKKGWDEPLKQNDHAVDALRYAVASHKVETYNPYKDKHNHEEYQRNRFVPLGRSFR